MTKSKSLVPQKANKRSANPFSEYQDKVVTEREGIIVRYLGSLRKTRAKFEYITDLAKAVAEQVVMAENAPCSFTTLLRNKRYKALLLNFMAMRSGTDTVQVSDPAAQALVHTVELELGNVKRDNERLRIYINELEAQLVEKQVAPLLPPVLHSDASEKLTKLTNDKAFACKALWLVLEHFKDLVSIDVDRGCIIDRSASKRKSVIVEPETARVFLEWVQSNTSIGK